VQRLLGRNRGPGDSDLRICGGIRRCQAILTDSEDQYLLASVIERNVLSRLEKAQLAHPLGGNPAGGKVRDAAGLQLQAHIGDVDLPRQDRQPDCTNLLDRRLGKCQHDVQIVDHQVEHNINIQRPWSKHAKPVNLEKHRLSQQRDQWREPPD